MAIPDLQTFQTLSDAVYQVTTKVCLKGCRQPLPSPGSPHKLFWLNYPFCLCLAALLLGHTPAGLNILPNQNVACIHNRLCIYHESLDHPSGSVHLSLLSSRHLAMIFDNQDSCLEVFAYFKV